MQFMNFGDIAKIAVISFAAIWIINRGLDKTGLGRFKA